jgi:N-acetylglucosaminyldiphosphoundecaprenol N-acetyl-beta-D-mannosaminyltransferase
MNNNANNNKKKVVLWGASGFSNMGDEAMLAGDLAKARELMGNRLDIVVLSFHPEVTAKMHKVRSEHDLPWLISKKTDGCAKLIKARILLSIAVRLVWNARRIKKGKSVKLLDHEERGFILTLAGADGFFIVGGGNINDIFVRGGLIARSFTCYLLKIMGKPIFVGAQTIGPLDRWCTRFLAKIFLRMCNEVTLRENFSKELLAEIGVQCEKIAVVADDAFNIIPVSREAAVGILANEGVDLENIKRKNQKIVAVIPRAWWKWKKESAPLRDALEDITNFLLNQKNIYTIFVSTSFFQGLGDDDAETAREIIGKTKFAKNDNYKVLSGRYDWNQLKGLLSVVNAVVGSSYHSIIFSASADVPVLGLYADEYYRLKIGGFFNLIGLEQLAIDVRNLPGKELHGIFEKFLDNEIEIKKSLARKNEEIRKRSCRAMSQMAKYLFKEKK